MIKFLLITIKLFVLLLFLFNSKLLSQPDQHYSQQTNSNYKSQVLKLDEFKDKYMFKKLFVVFAGPYPSSPSSSFGHIFLLFEPEKNRPVLLWDVLNYGVDVDTIGAIEMFTKGIFGGLFGEYKYVPFHVKLREYTFIESRPIWLFPLKLSESERIVFLENIYLQIDKKFAYRFHDKNCASMISEQLAVSLKRPIIDHSYTSPLDVLNEYKDDFESPYYIESTEKKINSLIELSDDSIKNPIIHLNLLEWKYSKRKQALSLQEQNQINKLRVLVSKSKQKKTSFLIPYHKEFYMHPPMKFGFGVSRTSNKQLLYKLNFRFGLHEFDDDHQVFPSYDFLSVGKLEASFNKNEFKLDKFYLVDQLSIPAITAHSNYVSWRLSLGLNRAYQLANEPLLYGFRFGLGSTQSIIKEKMNVSLLLNFLPTFVDSEGFKFFNQPELILTLPVSNVLKSKLSFSFISNEYQKLKYEYLLEQSISISFTKKIQTMFFYRVVKNSSIGSLNFNFSID
jgi:hypothetical protein